MVLSLLGRSWRITRQRSWGIRGNRVLYAFWHGVQLPLIYTHRNMGIRIMISRSRDGSLVSSLCENMGYLTARGSSSRGGETAFRQLLSSLKGGVPGAITPDGPKGPPGVAKKGVSMLPDRSGVPVVPYGVSAFPGIRLKSWDSFLVPLPFAKVVISEGRPVHPSFTGSETLSAAIDQQQGRAELAASPGAASMVAILKATGRMLTPLAGVILLRRPVAERRERMGFVPIHTGRPVWLHGASLGELKGLSPVMDRLRKARRDFHVTCSTPAGRSYLEGKGIDCSFAPLDLPGAVRRFLDRLSPSALILAETEFWPVLLEETVSRGIPGSMINARLSERSVRRYRLLKPLFSGILNSFRCVLTRSKEDTLRFRRLGVNAVTAGDGKAAVPPPLPDPSWRGMISRGPRGILVAGSTRKGEEETILRVASLTGLTPVLVPRHEGRIPEIVAACEELGYGPDLWSESPEGSRCLIVDVKGVLSALYGIADIAFVGGTLAPIGGHNVMEPLSHGVPLMVGPEHGHFRDAVQSAVKAGVCRVFRTPEEGAIAVKELLESRERAIEPPGKALFEERMMKLLELMEVCHAID